MGLLRGVIVGMFLFVPALLVAGLVGCVLYGAAWGGWHMGKMYFEALRNAVAAYKADREAGKSDNSDG